MRGAAAIIAAALSGLAFAFCLPPYDQEWLGWFALAPLLLAARGRRPVEALGLGLLTGVLIGAVHRFVSTPFLLLALMLGLVSWMAALASRRWTGITWVLFLACAGVSIEWLTTFAPMPVHLALCQYRSVSVIQLSALTGIWGVSFLLWWINTAFADWAIQKRLRSVPLVFGLVLAVVNAGYGLFTAAHIGARDANAMSDGPPIIASAIQDFSAGDAPQGWKGPATEEVDRETLTRRAVQSQRDASGGPGGADLVVWSEECLGSGFDPEDPQDETRRLARTLGIFLAAGYEERVGGTVHNCAALIGPDGKVLGIHRKVHLFPSERGVTPGQEVRAWPTPLGKVGVEICFDSCYTGVTRDLARQGARIILMPNFDPPTPLGSIHLLHSTMLPFRAVENRVPFVRADASGLSQIVGRNGYIEAQAPLYAAAALSSRVALGDGRGTPFTFLGDWLAYLCLAGAGSFTVASLAVRPKQAPGVPAVNDAPAADLPDDHGRDPGRTERGGGPPPRGAGDPEG